MLSVIIHTKNEAKNIKACIDSVIDLATEVLVVDMNSSDATVTIAKKLSPKIRILNYKADAQFADPARDWAIAKARGEWVFILDADERLENNELKNILKNLNDTINTDVFYLPRKNIIFDEWIKHTGWWPDYQPRLFRKGHLSWPGKVHAQPIVKGKIKYLPAEPNYALGHYNYENVAHFIDKLNRYTSLAAAQKVESRVRNVDGFGVFGGEFLARFFKQEGYQDGGWGAALSLLQANYELVTYLKSCEKNKQEPLFRESALRKWQRDLNYWLADKKVKEKQGLAQIYWRLRRKLRV